MITPSQMTFQHSPKVSSLGPPGGGSLLHHRPPKPPSQSPTSQPKQTAEGSAKVTARPSSKQQRARKKQRNTSDKSLKMGLFHMKKGTPVSKALPEKSTLKEGVCLDFCCHERKCNYNHLPCKNGKHYTNWKNVPEDDRLILLMHMAKNIIAPEFAHLLGDATGPKRIPAEKST